MFALPSTPYGKQRAFHGLLDTMDRGYYRPPLFFVRYGLNSSRLRVDDITTEFVLGKYYIVSSLLGARRSYETKGLTLYAERG